MKYFLVDESINPSSFINWVSFSSVQKPKPFGIDPAYRVRRNDGLFVDQVFVNDED